MRSFDSLQRGYDNMLPPDDDKSAKCLECRIERHEDDMHNEDMCRQCWKQADKCGHCGELEHGECRDFDDLGVDE